MSEGVRRRKEVKVVEEVVPEADENPQGAVSWGKAACFGLLGALVILPVIIWLIPCPIEPVAFSYPEPPEMTGALAPNTHLQKAMRLYENELVGPESILVDGDYLYTGTADGKVLVIYKGEIRVLAELGRKPCGRFEDEPTCGRPLGMRLDKAGYLIVCDGYLGLFKINVATGDVFTLWPSSAPINGKTMKLLNDLDIASDGTIYMSDSSTKWDRRHNRYCIMEAEDSGRLLSYDPKTNTTQELVSGIPFANGVQLSRDQSYLLLVSTTLAKIYKYNLQGPNKGKLEIFNDNIPGLPDNIRRSSYGGYWVGLAAVRKRSFSAMDFGAPRPWIRSLFTKLFSQELLTSLIPKYGLIIHLNERGEITKSLHDPTGTKITAVSEIEDKNGILYMGSYNLPYLAKINLNSIKMS